MKKRFGPRIYSAQTTPVIQIFYPKERGWMGWIKRVLTFIGGVVVVLSVLSALTTIAFSFKPVPLPDAMVLTLNLEGNLPEQNRYAALDKFIGRSSGTVLGVVNALERAEKDERVKGLYVTISSEGDYSPTQAETLRDAFNRFRAKGKFLHVYADSLQEYGNGMPAYQIAAASDFIALQPSGSLTLTGYGADIPYFKALLDKVGVKAEIGQREKYKTGPETQLSNEMSAEETETLTNILQTYTAEFAASVAADRKIAIGDVLTDMNSMPYSAEKALEFGYIDAIMHQPDAYDMALSAAKTYAEPIDLFDYNADIKQQIVFKPDGKKIAVLYLEGVIVGGSQDSPDQIAADLYAEALEDVYTNDDIGALVVRVNSPGGTPQAAEKIRAGIERLVKGGTSVYLTMADYAASGGYWVAVDATEILAQRTTLTGSIGVYGGKYDASALAKKMGITTYSIGTTDVSGMWSMLLPYTAAGKASSERMLDTVYSDFKTRVAEGRGLTKDKVQELAQGKVYTGVQALQVSLVDGVGFERDALNKAAVELGYTDRLEAPVVNVTPLPDPVGLAAELFGVRLARFVQTRLVALQAPTYMKVPTLN